MTTSILPRLPMTKALKAMLEAGLGADWHVGIVSIPRIPEAPGSDTLVPVEPPYFILYPLWSSTSGPPFAAPDADSEWVYQLTAFGTRGDQLEWMRDKALRLFLERDASGAFTTPLVVAGMHVMDRTLKEDAGTEPPGAGNASSILTADVRVGIKVTPA